MTRTISDMFRNQRGAIFVDESGNAGTRALDHNKKYPYFVIGFCYCKNPKLLQKEMYRTLRKCQKEKLYHSKLGEFKFYPTPQLQKMGCTKNEIKKHWKPHYDEIREKIINVILSNSDGIFAGILYKNQKNCKEWRAEEIQSQLFMKSIVEYILPSIKPRHLPVIVYDLGSLTQGNKLLNDKQISHQNTSTTLSEITYYKNSIKSPQIWASDIIAGSFYHAYQHNDFKYVEQLKPKFIENGFFEFKVAKPPPFG